MNQEQARTCLDEIMQDLHQWPQMADSRLLSVELLAIEINADCARDVATILVNLKRPEEDCEIWSLMQVTRSYVPYFRRVIWFYRIIPDGPDTPISEQSSRPSDELVAQFLKQWPLENNLEGVFWHG
ncbi:hypothetical protein [Coralloluteibacterium thermophilus]|uniref:Uncharacterized protein n=1 Tax=Coralloluteibacterium thermophilum TaxID=2707049 RepID=A0ABV9NIS8_9GAMM